MPETAMYKQNAMKFRKDEVRAPGEVSDVKPISVAPGVKVSSYDEFRFGVLAPDG